MPEIQEIDNEADLKDIPTQTFTLQDYQEHLSPEFQELQRRSDRVLGLGDRVAKDFVKSCKDRVV